MWHMLLLIQVVAPSEPGASLPRFVPPACEKASGDEILVCRRRPAGDRIGPRLPDAVEPLLPQAEFRLFGKARASLAGEQRGVGGFSVPAGMFSVKLPF